VGLLTFEDWWRWYFPLVRPEGFSPSAGSGTGFPTTSGLLRRRLPRVKKLPSDAMLSLFLWIVVSKAANTEESVPGMLRLPYRFLVVLVPTDTTACPSPRCELGLLLSATVHSRYQPPNKQIFINRLLRSQPVSCQFPNQFVERLFSPWDLSLARGRRHHDKMTFAVVGVNRSSEPSCSH
jgi:hypothetical protein